MRVQLITHLKTHDKGLVTPQVYDEVNGPFPDYIQRNLKFAHIIKVLDPRPVQATAPEVKKPSEDDLALIEQIQEACTLEELFDLQQKADQSQAVIEAINARSNEIRESEADRQLEIANAEKQKQQEINDQNALDEELQQKEADARPQKRKRKLNLRMLKLPRYSRKQKLPLK